MSKKRAKQVFDFIIEYKRSNDGNAPSVRDIQDGIDYHSMSGVVSALKFLEKHKLIERKGKERYICVTGGRWYFRRHRFRRNENGRTDDHL